MDTEKYYFLEFTLDDDWARASSHTFDTLAGAKQEKLKCESRTKSYKYRIIERTITDVPIEEN